MVKKNVTLQMIADKVGVSKSTVSEVLRDRRGRIQASEATRLKIFDIARKLNFEPNAAARSLITGKTYNIGFLLSSHTNLGIANNYFASILSGVQYACRVHGYNCIVSVYDLSSVKDFVMPMKLKRRTVDAVVISGYVEEEVLQCLIQNNTPFILIGETTDFPLEGILNISRDMVADWLKIFEYLYKLGHRRIGVGGTIGKRWHTLLDDAISRFGQIHSDASLDFVRYNNVPRDDNVFLNAFEQGAKWAKSNSSVTAVVGHDQWCLGFLSGIRENGKNCPQDVSVVSSCDTILCQWGYPSITAISMPLYESGSMATEILVNLIENKITVMEAHRMAAKSLQERQLIVRKSTGPAPGYKQL